jgi:membrane protease YdiL (CAAX protease family)
MSTIKKSLIFSLAVLPIAIVAIIFTCLYQFEMYPPEILEEAVAQVGSMALVWIITLVQNVGLIMFCCFFGYILAEKLGLWKPIIFEKRSLTVTFLLSALVGIILSLDPWTFGNLIDGIKESTAAGMTVYGIIASILYGGIIEEILMRLFVMSLIAFLIAKIFYKKCDEIPAKVFVIANIVAALLFAAGHLPATLVTFGELSPMLLFRCFLFNGGFGMLFGWLYRKHGLHYAMLSHMTAHIVSKIIWFVFI